MAASDISLLIQQGIMGHHGAMHDSTQGRRAAILVSVGLGLAAVLVMWLDGSKGEGDSHAATETRPSLFDLAPVPERAEEGYSNVRNRDYVGPENCGECHEERYQQWSGNLHRKMNRLSSESGAVLGDFEDRNISYAGGRLQLQHLGADYFMVLKGNTGPQKRYRVTRTIGSRYLQEYVGVLAAIDGVKVTGKQTELRLPFGYLLGMKRWLHQQYFDSWHDREYTKGTPTHDPFVVDPAPWSGRCAWCHNTYSFEKRLARMQGPNRVGSGIEQLYTDQKQFRSSESERRLLPTEELVSVGISCESCHFGGREHAENDEKIRFAPTSPRVHPVSEVAAIAGVREDSRTINAICAQCHSVPTQLYPNGAGIRNSSEALDLLVGNCASQIKCTDCHDPHVPGPGAMAQVQQNHIEACIDCHPQYSEPEAAGFHSLHSPEITCLDCHMPRIVQGLASPLRTHRISSPEDLDMLRGGINACNLCHLDKSVAWTVAELNASHGTRLPERESTEKPWPTQPAALQWLQSDKRIERLTAAGALGNSPYGLQFAPMLLRLLNAESAYSRLRYLWAVEGIVGRELGREEFDVMGAPPLRAQQVQELEAHLFSF